MKKDNVSGPPTPQPPVFPGLGLPAARPGHSVGEKWLSEAGGGWT
jgi:hypothetical protein